MNFKFLRNLISASHATLALVLVALNLDSLTQLSMAVQLGTRKDENFTKSPYIAKLHSDPEYPYPLAQPFASLKRTAYLTVPHRFYEKRGV